MPAMGVSACASGEEGRLTLGEKSVHHPLDDIYSILERQVDEIGIHYHSVWRYERLVVL
jgi:hypothetical protein